MCVVKTPRITPGSEKPKDPAIIRSVYLDGVDPRQKAMRKGRSSLRIDRTGGRAPAAASPPSVSTPPASLVPPPDTPIMVTVPGGTMPVLGGGGRINRNIKSV